MQGRKMQVWKVWDQNCGAGKSRTDLVFPGHAQYVQNHANFVRAGSSTAVQRLFICAGWRSKKTRLATNLEVDNMQNGKSLTTICDSSGLHLMVFCIYVLCLGSC